MARSSMPQALRGLLAALTLYTRLPLWRVVTLGKADYELSVNYWPLTGIVTGGVMAGVALLGGMLFPPMVAIALAVVARLLLTGAFHEDGLGDFLDGMGGGREREQVLRIMKDSHVGSYAALGYALYALLLLTTLSALPSEAQPYALIVGDCGARALTLNQLRLPYARTESDSKLGLCYRLEHPTLALLLPLLIALGVSLTTHPAVALTPLLVSLALILYIRRRIGGYTGDTLGASYLITELSAYLALLAYYQLCA